LRRGGHSEQLKNPVFVLQSSFYPVHLSASTHSTYFIPEDGDRFILRNIGINLQDYDVSQTKRPQSESATELLTLLKQRHANINLIFFGQLNFKTVLY
jgi:hypothetical protein